MNKENLWKFPQKEDKLKKKQLYNYVKLLKSRKSVLGGSLQGEQTFSVNCFAAGGRKNSSLEGKIKENL